MRDLTASFWIKVKSVLFLVVGLSASALLVLEHPTIKIALLLILSIWSFCRFYYFAFYVIQHYVDSTYRFSGLVAFFGYLVSKNQKKIRG
jgi:hypothetical protein